MPHVIRIPETESEMRWERWSSWTHGDERWHVTTLDTSTTPREAAARKAAAWIAEERDLLHRGDHPLSRGRWTTD